ncbi:aspartate--tRNA ligase [Aliifodinibius sp. S!AR15-10]|uniref:aspartate--tRNA ligase n=1 Tax=Aliifodinibius sp. S!AR15-10 TaxID=2950437 RepID=UPI0028549027|nr:aspartate--tRNA ligase [Aliifodinibius sp. S!AR15-10]MDR8392090.1 aspartate--tRNA ligase [Aliifodinibius sp. S!AR15-10]
MSLKRTHTCGELSEQNIGDQVTLNGWVSARRDLGGVIFIDLRDRYGITQIVFKEEDSEAHAIAEDIRSEYVLGIKGHVEKRSDDTVNPDIATGRVEVFVDEIKIYSEAETPPFEIKDGVETGEELRLKHRYLDLRRPEVQKNMMLRSDAYHSIRSYFHEADFAEVETPFLMKSTPEGARDYLVPSRVNPGKFFALPQSPQTYKQLLMVSGYDRYFQIVKCFRDEDLRADRQPEFTQVDVEMSFVDEDDIMEMTEGLMQRLIKDTMDKEVSAPFPRMTYEEAIKTYGTDKPDTRFGLKFVDFSELVADSEFKIFSKTVQNGGGVLGIKVPGQGTMGRGELDRLTERVQNEIGSAGLVYIKQNEEEGTKCSVGKFLKDETIDAMNEKAGAGMGDIVLILAGPKPTVYEQLGELRLMMGKEHGLIDESEYNMLWVTDFPLVAWDEDTQRYHALHHPFTSPKNEDLEKMDSDPSSVSSRAYDLVLNGYEIGGGSIRIHNREVQKKMFRLLGIDEKEAEKRFGFLLEAFKYGAPPHGGIALGVDRIIMLLSGGNSLRDVIAFPKNQKAQNLMDGSPDYVDPEQLDDLHIRLQEDIKQQN